MQRTISEIAKVFPEYRLVGSGSSPIHTAVPVTDIPGQILPGAVSWVNERNTSLLVDASFTLGLLICSENSLEVLQEKNSSFLISDNPRLAFTRVMDLLFRNEFEPGIAITAAVDPDTAMGANCSIGQFVVIEEGCTLGNHVSIGHHTVVKRGTVIGENSQIGCHVTIGGDGFGYEKNTNGSWIHLPHLGSVIIGRNVRIHNHVCIDRAVLGTTEIGDGVCIDNHVHVAHGVKVGEHSLLIAHAMIGGSVHIGKNCWIAPSASIRNQLTIGDGAVVGMGAVVVKDVDPGVTVAGNPARPLPGR